MRCAYMSSKYVHAGGGNTLVISTMYNEIMGLHMFNLPATYRNSSPQYSEFKAAAYFI